MSEKEGKLKCKLEGHRMSRLNKGPTDNLGTATSEEQPLGLMEAHKRSYPTIRATRVVD